MLVESKDVPLRDRCNQLKRGPSNLAKTMALVYEDLLPVIITSRDEPAVVMLSLEEFRTLYEASYLLRSRPTLGDF